MSATTTTVRAVGVEQPGGPDALTVFEVAAEPLGPGQVRIAVSAAAVSPTDSLVRSRPRGDAETGPRVPGMDIAGVVTETSSDAFAVGESVMAIVVPSGAHGGYRADIVLPAASVAAIPAGASLAEAATLPMNGLTAQLALDTMALPAGSTLAVTGAAGILGGYVVQLAKLAGLHVVVDAKPGDEAFLTACGADEILSRSDSFADAVRASHPAGVDGVVDCAVLNEAALPAAADGGVAVTVRGWDGAGESRVRVAPVFVSNYAGEGEKLAHLGTLVTKGSLTLRVAGEFPADQAPEAHRLMEAGGQRGRFVLRFDR